jgi:hypothetical protein
MQAIEHSIVVLILLYCCDYAARDKDEVQVKECYGNIVAAIDQIFARIM